MPFARRQLTSPDAAVARAGACRAAFRVAGTTFDLWSSGDISFELEECVRAFAVQPEAGEVRIQVRWSGELKSPSGEPLFHSGGVWSLFEEPDGCRFYFSTPQLGRIPYKTAWFDPAFRHGEVALFRPYFDANLPIYPLEYPLDELVMIHRLAAGEGVEVHAVGIVDRSGRGHLFLGHSGAGKSTTARLWQSQPNTTVLSDDRIVLRVQDGRTWMYGTPWHGDAGIASSACALLSHIYLLEHGHQTELSPVSRGRAAAELFARSFVPHYSKSALEFTLSLLDQIAERVPCQVFRFLPDRSAVEAICRAAQ